MADSATSTPPTATTSLRHKTVRGVMWLIVQSVATRGVTVLQQVALAWFLVKEDFGLIALTYTVSTFITLLANPGIDTVLIQRQRRYRCWATPAFWLGMSTGLIGMFLMALAAPVAAWAYGRPKLVGLILVLAIAAPLQTLQIVPRAKLQGSLQFRTLVSLTFLGNILTAMLSVLLAYFGFGAYSFAVPVPIVAGIVAATAWWLAGTTVQRDPHIRRWKYLLGDGAAMSGTRFLQMLISQGDYLCLGLAGVSEASIGIYYFAFRLSTQSFSLIANSVPMVLFPSLSQLVLDPHRQLRSTMRASRLLALVAIPFCMLQILLAEPMIRLLCPPPWLDAVLPLQILTVGIMVNAPAWPANSLLMAQRRFGELLHVSMVCTTTFFAAVGGALMFEKSIVSVAIAVCLWYLWATPYYYWVAVRPHVPFYGYFVEVYRPFLAGLVPFVLCAFMIRQFPIGGLTELVGLVVTTMIYCAIYLGLLRSWAAKDFHDLFIQITPLWDRLKGWSAL